MKRFAKLTAVALILTVIIAVTVTVILALTKGTDEPGRIAPVEMRYKIIECALFHDPGACGRSGADAIQDHGIKRP